MKLIFTKITVIMSLIFFGNIASAQSKKKIILQGLFDPNFAGLFLFKSITNIDTFNNNLIIKGQSAFTIGWGLDHGYSYLGQVDYNLDTTSMNQLYRKDSGRIYQTAKIAIAKSPEGRSLYTIEQFFNETSTTAMPYSTSTYIRKYDAALNLVDSSLLIDTYFTETTPRNILYYDHALYISGNRLNKTSTDSVKIFIAKLDTNLNVKWIKHYTSYSRYVGNQNMHIHQNKIYLTGYCDISTFTEKKIFNVFDIIDTAGFRKSKKSLPYLKHEATPHSSIHSSIDHGGVIIVASGLPEKDYASENEKKMNKLLLRYLDTNLNVLNTKTIQLQYAVDIKNVKKISEDKLLLVGVSNVLRASPFKFYRCWSCLIDTSGNILWEREYDIDKLSSELHDGLALNDSTFVLFGSIDDPFQAGYQLTGLVIKTDKNGCMDSTFCYPIDPVYQYPIKHQIFPNPTSDILYINLDSTKIINQKLRILDTYGNVMKDLEGEQNAYQINTENWLKGVYIIHLTGDNYHYTHRLLKQ